MKPLTQIAHELIRREVAELQAPASPSLFAIDATAGNGHDTLFLAELVGPTGRVWAVDIQADAIARTQLRVGEWIDRVELHRADHANLKSIVPAEMHGRISIVMFNLGYLPGGEKSMITRTGSTLVALDAASELLGPGGLLSMIAYPGHPGGDQEALAVASWIAAQAETFEIASEPLPNAVASSPRHWLVRRVS